MLKMGDERTCPRRASCHWAWQLHHKERGRRRGGRGRGRERKGRRRGEEGRGGGGEEGGGGGERRGRRRREKGEHTCTCMSTPMSHCHSHIQTYTLLQNIHIQQSHEPTLYIV